MTKILISYDKENDILSLHKGFSDDEKFKGNIDAGLLVLDVSTKGRIRGIEIMNASESLKEFGINKEVLENIERADFKAVINPNGIIIGFAIKAKNIVNEMPAKIIVPLETPMVC